MPLTPALPEGDSPVRVKPAETPECPNPTCGEVIRRIVVTEGTSHARCESCGQHMLIVAADDYCATSPLTKQEFTLVLGLLSHRRDVRKVLLDHVRGRAA